MEPQLQFEQCEHEQQQSLQRSICSSRALVSSLVSRMYHLTYKQLLADLHTAYLDAKRQKGNKRYVQSYEKSLEVNLQVLGRELWSRTYKPRPSTCFIITDPKIREVFAADFRDRIVHHLYYNYTHELFERTFIQDSYSCIPGRGTLYGVERLEKHIRQESQNYQKPCYVLKMDIKGYFNVSSI